jgi:hypothetical protein
MAAERGARRSWGRHAGGVSRAGSGGCAPRQSRRAGRCLLSPKSHRVLRATAQPEPHRFDDVGALAAGGGGGRCGAGGARGSRGFQFTPSLSMAPELGVASSRDDLEGDGRLTPPGHPQGFAAPAPRRGPKPRRGDAHAEADGRVRFIGHGTSIGGRAPAILLAVGGAPAALARRAGGGGRGSVCAITCVPMHLAQAARSPAARGQIASSAKPRHGVCPNCCCAGPGGREPPLCAAIPPLSASGAMRRRPVSARALHSRGAAAEMTGAGRGRPPSHSVAKTVMAGLVVFFALSARAPEVGPSSIARGPRAQALGSCLATRLEEALAELCADPSRPRRSLTRLGTTRWDRPRE